MNANNPAQNIESPAAIIKKATAAAHLSTEKLLVKYVKQVSSNKAYAELLACMHGYFAPLEKQLDQQMAALLPDHALRRKAGNMLNDIEALQQKIQMPVAASFPDTSGAAAAMGACYVMEGSTLGGTVITKMIKGSNPDIPANAFSFFSGYGENNMMMWQSFVARLNDVLQSEEKVNKAIEAANASFAGLEKWITAYYQELRK